MVIRMSDSNLELFVEAAQALRDFGSKIGPALDNIDSATENLERVYSSVSEGLGVHAEQIDDILQKIHAAEAKISEPVKELPPKMNKTAELIDIYVERMSFQ